MGDLFLNLVRKEQGSLDFTFSTASRACLFHLHLHRRSNPLSRDLHESELTEREHIMLRAVAIHQFSHIVIQLLLMLFRIHVDKIDDDDSSDIPQAKLVHQFIGLQHIELECIFLLVLVDFLAA